MSVLLKNGRLAAGAPLLLCLALVISACSDSGAAPTLPSVITREDPRLEIAIGQPFTLAAQQTAKVGNLLVTFDSVLTDDRCPTEVQCVEAGSARILVLAHQQHHEGETTHNHEKSLLKLDTLPVAELHSVSFADLTIELLELIPQKELPEDVIDQREYQATFIVQIGDQ